jgi:4'-phosphopantetheinyl transferase
MGARYSSVGPVLIAWAGVAIGGDIGADRDRAFRAGRVLLAELLGGLGCDASPIVFRCEVCGGGDHGRPTTASGEALVSVGYAAGLVVVTAAPASVGRALGVDVEADRGPEAMRDLAALFAPCEPPDIRGWTVIEAALKADGRGLRIPPSQVTRTFEPGLLLPGGRRVTVPGRGSRIEVAAGPAPDGFVVSVAIDPGSESPP